MTPDGIEPIVAWRYWKLDPTIPALTSLNKSGVWLPGEPMKASCGGFIVPMGPATMKVGDSTVTVKHARIVFGTDADHGSPGDHCRCGIHAAVDLLTLRRAVQFLTPVNLVVGTVKLWGKVIPGEMAHRAEYAYPHELFGVPETFADGFDPTDFLETYGVPVSTMSLDECEPSFSSASRVIGHLAMSAAAAGRAFAETMRKVQMTVNDVDTNLLTLLMTGKAEEVKERARRKMPVGAKPKDWTQLNARDKRDGWR